MLPPSESPLNSRERTASTMTKVSFVIPIYRAQDTLCDLYQRIVNVFSDNAYELEIIFIEDCGGDQSWERIVKIAAKDDRVKGIKMSRNFGQHNALLCGIRLASGDLIVTMDDDLQHPPEVVPRLLYKIDDGFDVVYGPPEKEQHGLFRDLASQITKLALQRSMGAENAKQVSALRVFKTKLRDAFSTYQSPMVNIDVLLTWGTNRFAAVRVHHDARCFGKSGYTVGKLITHAFNMITGFSTMPLRVASGAGFSFAFFGFGILGYLLLRWVFVGSVVPGFLFIASMVAIFSGVQLLALGIMGEYLARIHLRSMDRPPYFVDRST